MSTRRSLYNALQSVTRQSVERRFSGLLVVHQFLEAAKHAPFHCDVFRAHKQYLTASEYVYNRAGPQMLDLR